MTSLTLASSAYAAPLIDEDFEDYTTGTPSGWSGSGSQVISPTTGLDGSTTSAQIGINSSGSTNSGLTKILTATDTFSLQFDFSQLSTGNNPNGGDR